MRSAAAEGTIVTVKREGTLFRGPGIGDNCRGLAVLVAVAKTLVQSGFRPAGSITFVANVGEEGLGDLRGVRMLFEETMKGKIDRFVAIDGPGHLLVTESVGSHRYRVTFKEGPAPPIRLHCRIPDLFHGDRLDYEALARHVSESCPEPSANPCIPLANMRPGDDGCDPDRIDISIRPIVYANDLLLEIILSLVEEGRDRHAK